MILGKALLLAFAGLLLATGSAQAGPAIAAATAIGTALGFVGTVATIVGAVLVIGTVALATKAIKRKQQQQQNQIAGVLVTKAGTTSPIPVVYGQRRIGGTRVFIASDGSENIYLHVVEALCEGPIEGCTELYLADELAATSSNNGASWSIESAFNGFIDIHFKDGSQTGALAAHTFSNLDNIDEHADWPSTAVGNKLAYVYLVIKFDQDKFGGGLPQITYTVKGKKLPAIGSDHDTTLTFSAEPARCIYDYLINPLYGKAIPFGLLDTTTFNSGASYNAATVAKTASDSTAVTRYEAHAYIDTDRPLLENLETLFTTCRGGLITGDTYKFIQDRVTTPSSVTINDDNIVGTINFIQANKKTLLNHIRAKFPNEASGFNYQEDISIVESSTLQGATKDGLKFTIDIELAYTTNAEMTARILTEEINSSRQSSVIEVDVDPTLIDLAVGDVVKFTNTTLGQTDKLYRILKTVVKPDHVITINMKEYDTNVYWDNNKTIITDNKNDTDH